MEFIAGDSKSSQSSTMLAPGFRFHPTDEELVRYYLRRKVCGKGFRFEAISDIDIYKFEPWDLPSFSKLKARDLEWYFFSMLDKKYGNGSKTNRATEKGYWKTTGKDRDVYHKSRIVGMKKTLVYHSGRAPKGQRSNWVMHEYRLTDLQLEEARIAQDAFVLCRVFQKSGSGPKNGERYGAPFVEEEWEDDVLELVPKVEAAEEADNAYLDGHDLEQILGSDDPSHTPPVKLHSEDGSCVEGTAESANGARKVVIDAAEQYCEPKQHVDNHFHNSNVQHDMHVRAVKCEHIGESSKSDDFDCSEFLLDELHYDSSDNAQVQSGFEGCTESNMSSSIKSSIVFDMLEDYCPFIDTNDNNTHHFAYDPSAMLEADDVISRQVLLPLKELHDETEQCTSPSKQLNDDNSNDDASTSVPDELNSLKCKTDLQYPFTKQASHMLGSTNSVLAPECSSKDVALLPNSLSHPSSSVHVTAGMIQIRNLTSSNGRDQSLDKPKTLKIILSFGFSQRDDGSATLESNVSVILPGKNITTLSRGWFYFVVLFMMLFLCISFKTGTYLHTK